MVQRELYDDDHLAFAASVRAWAAKELVPHLGEWEAAGIAPRQIFADAGALGFTGMAIPEQFGGGGTDDYRFNAVIAEEFSAAGLGGAGLGITLHNDIVTPYFLEYCNDEQRRRWLPGIAAGTSITALAMTEPGAGSDVAGFATSAVGDGDSYIVNGSKTFITNGINADLVVVVVRTDASSRHGGLSLLVLERGMEGFERGRNLEKLGLHSQDTAELFFTDVHVPAENLLGEEGRGFEYLAHNLAQERLSIAVSAVATARAALGWTLEYVGERTAFGKPLASFQNTKFTLAEVHTEVEVTQAFVDNCIRAHVAKQLSAAEAATAKWWATEMQKRAVDACLQLFGGYGYMLEYPIARAYADARVTTIYGGTTEIMKGIVAKSLGL